MRWDTAVEAFELHLWRSAQYSPNTVRAYLADVAAFRVTAECPLPDLAPHNVHRFTRSVLAAGSKPKTARRRLSGVRVFCRWLVDQRVLESNPCEGITVTGDQWSGPHRATTGAEVRRLLNHLIRETRNSYPDHPSPLLAAAAERTPQATTMVAAALIVATGMKPAEVTALRARDIDLPNASITVASRRRDRSVWMANDWLLALLEEYLPAGPTDPVFTARSGQPLSPTALRKRITNASRSAGLDPPITPQALRHAAATELLTAGVSLQHVQALLGHSRIESTGVYLHSNTTPPTSARDAIHSADVLRTHLPPGSATPPPRH